MDLHLFLWLKAQELMVRCELETGKGDAWLWLADPAEMCPGNEPMCTALLDPDERVRAEAFHFAIDRQVYLTTRALVRVALSHSHGTAPELWRFRSNKYGKPETDPACGLRFNVAHTRHLVVCLVSRGIELGVDAEGEDRAAEIVAIAKEVFSQTELEQMLALQEAEQENRALTLWTLKEAYAKALGLGLSFPLKRASFVFDAGGQIRFDVDAEQDTLNRSWQFCVMNYAAHRIAVVIERTPGLRLKRVRMRSPGETPILMADGAEQWSQSDEG